MTEGPKPPEPVVLAEGRFAEVVDSRAERHDTVGWFYGEERRRGARMHAYRMVRTARMALP